MFVMCSPLPPCSLGSACRGRKAIRQGLLKVTSTQNRGALRERKLLSDPCAGTWRGECGARHGAPSASTLRDGGLLDCLCHAYVMLSEVSQMASLFRAPGGKKCGVHLNAGFEM